MKLSTEQMMPTVPTDLIAEAQDYREDKLKRLIWWEAPEREGLRNDLAWGLIYKHLKNVCSAHPLEKAVSPSTEMGTAK